MKKHSDNIQMNGLNIKKKNTFRCTENIQYF